MDDDQTATTTQATANATATIGSPPQTATALTNASLPSPIQPLGFSSWSYMTQNDQEIFEEALIPPENFNMVCEHVYRSSFPKKKHFRFLEKLKLKSVL